MRSVLRVICMGRPSCTVFLSLAAVWVRTPARAHAFSSATSEIPNRAARVFIGSDQTRSYSVFRKIRSAIVFLNRIFQRGTSLPAIPRTATPNPIHSSMMARTPRILRKVPGYCLEPTCTR